MAPTQPPRAAGQRGFKRNCGAGPIRRNRSCIKPASLGRLEPHVAPAAPATGQAIPGLAVSERWPLAPSGKALALAAPHYNRASSTRLRRRSAAGCPRTSQPEAKSEGSEGISEQPSPACGWPPLPPPTPPGRGVGALRQRQREHRRSAGRQLLVARNHRPWRARGEPRREPERGEPERGRESRERNLSILSFSHSLLTPELHSACRAPLASSRDRRAETSKEGRARTRRSSWSGSGSALEATKKRDADMMR